MPTSIVPGSIWKFGWPTAGQRAGTEADADRAAVVDGLLGGRPHLLEACALRCLGAADLPHEDLAGNAAALFALVRWRGADVVIGNDGCDLDAVLGGKLDRHFHVHVVAGIVAIEADDALAAIGLADGIVKALGGRRGEQLADGHGIQHVPAGIADEGRLMAGAAAGDDADLAGDRGMPGDDDARVLRRARTMSEWALTKPLTVSSTTWSGSLINRCIMSP